MLKKIFSVLLIALSIGATFGQSDYSFDPNYRIPDGKTHYYKFAVLPRSNGGTGEIVTIRLIGGGFLSKNKKVEEMFMSNRDGFKASIIQKNGDLNYNSVRIEAYKESNGSVSVYLVMGDTYSHSKIFCSTSGISSQNILISNPNKLTLAPSNIKVFSSVELNTLSINKNGNVGIGTTNPELWKLAVNGKIRAKEIKVETGWSDFVFFSNYQLPTLKEVENHIQNYGHLKDIPSSKEVEENGIFLGEMDSKVLQKIEELTLYTIQQEKKIKEQAIKIEKLETLNNKLLELQSRLEKLESEKLKSL